MNMSIIFSGHAITIPGSNVNADMAMGWYLGMDALQPQEIAAKFMSGVDPDIARKVARGDILVCGRNFGYGKVHTSLFTAMKVLGMKCIVAESFSTQMVQTALNMGVYLVEVPSILDAVDFGDEIEVDVEKAAVVNRTKGVTIQGKPFPPFLVEVMQSGGQVGHLAKVVMARRALKLSR